MHCDSDSSVVCTDSQYKWQITLSSKNCTIKKHFEGWQVGIVDREFITDISITYISSQNAINGEKDLRLTLTVPKLEINSQCTVETTKTADAEICCNREDLEELLEAEDEDSDRAGGNIILTDYLKLIRNDETRINLLLKILTKAVNEHKCYVICGTFPALRKPMTGRGWIEKRAIRKMMSIAPNAYEGRMFYFDS
ncbi:PREDICTED: uncharacterized protein LOC105567214 [Vollenhovia emeryi]|uniref:uncharacterized protein LOC105567214 n=1 Tax=Vollenhovia emeryi TaxID=411798 RepID=UPI0005F46E56|nr:PREDICTED: uncharacterized protein LOC105567214 [Vollenhovia emeryi]